MTKTVMYIKEWQQALQNEIMYLKKYGSNKYRVTNGRQLSTDGAITYYFDTAFSLKIPVGSLLLFYGADQSREDVPFLRKGKDIIQLEQSLGELILKPLIYHDPWELLEKLIERLDEISKSKQKRVRVNRLMNPSMPAKHPEEKIKSNVHEVVLRSKSILLPLCGDHLGQGKRIHWPGLLLINISKKKQSLYFHTVIKRSMY